MSENDKGIYGALLNVMGGIGAIEKDRTNTGQGYKFRGIDDVYNALNPLMVEHGVFCAPHVTGITREERTSSKGTTLIYTMVEVDYGFYTADGSCLTVHVAGEGMDSGDKSLNKAMSAAHKYALLQMFCIPTEEGELKDSEGDSHELGSRPKADTPRSSPPKQTPGAKICSECGKPMMLRKPKAGGDEFWGCTGYPSCRHTAPIVGREKTPLEEWWIRVSASLLKAGVEQDAFKAWTLSYFKVRSSKELEPEQLAYLESLATQPGILKQAMAGIEGDNEDNQ